VVTSSTVSTSPTRLSRWQRFGPVVTLLILSPAVSELLSGSTRVTTLFVLIPSTGVWGCAALIIRELARRRGRSWRSILLLGLALAVAEECVIQQTSLAPLIGIDPEQVYGRAHGVNWEYFLWALGFESVWAVVIPIALTESLFPRRRDDLWLGNRGLAIAAAVFALASFLAWYSWTQVFVPRFFPDSAYHPPSATIQMALGSIVALVAIALWPTHHIEAQRISNRGALHPAIAGLVSFAIALPWYLQVLLAFSAWPTLPITIAIIAGVLLAGIALVLAALCSARYVWDDAHTLAAMIGVFVATLLGGFVALDAGKALMIDRVGQVIFSIAAIAFVIAHMRKPRSHSPTK
jgi:hypothetical protein